MATRSVPQPPAGRCARVRLAGSVQGFTQAQAQTQPSPQPMRRRNRAGHTCLLPSHGKRAPAIRRPPPTQPVTPAKAGASGVCRTPSSPLTVMPDLIRHPPGSQHPAWKWTPDQARGDGCVEFPPAPHPHRLDHFAATRPAMTKRPPRSTHFTARTSLPYPPFASRD